MLSRVVLHPKYRGSGIASAFIRRSCELTSVPWIETLAEMGNINPFFEKAGFIRLEKSTHGKKSRKLHSAIYGGASSNGQKRFLTEETWKKSRFARPVYFIFDNRQSINRRKGNSSG